MAFPAELDRNDLLSRLVTAALVCAHSLRDLDAYEDLPEMIRTEAIHAFAAQHARRILQDELEQLELDGSDAMALQEAVSDLSRRADWYNVEIDVAPALDVVDELTL